MSVIIYNDEGPIKVNPKHLQAHLDNGYRLTKEKPKAPVKKTSKKAAKKEAE